MELTESIESINSQLINLFGVDTVSGRAIWRVVWSMDQFEKRLVNVTAEGFELLTPIVREVPKYRQWIQNKYILEQLVAVPDYQVIELGGLKTSYEPKFVFSDKDDNYLPPLVEVCVRVIKSIQLKLGKITFAEYAQSAEEAVEEQKKKVDEVIEYLYGNESDVSDALTRKEGIVVPQSYNHSDRVN